MLEEQTLMGSQWKAMLMYDQKMVREIDGEWVVFLSKENGQGILTSQFYLTLCRSHIFKGFPLDHNNRELLQFGRFRTNSGSDHSTDCAWDCVEWA
ncbi:hypothetical protein LWI28_002143 [Acer negundo]|uniref:Uncharacterized protein n=1 Tax=Acer negundo TaxID=4023 RepID=A0AAD5JIM0_ACENE|nr:hypothetical protein LWI28_002143 [Acer negundo]